ncbi:MAG: ATP-dependent Clp protease adapter ClpS [Desulfobacteraceae bacterium]|nr:ATP-dependent Clp protease adapter ClpS [Desulfobacteraceae bacterium]
MSLSRRDSEGWVITEQQQKVEEPPLYRVILHNDDYTTMDFVVMVLETIFHRTTVEATQIMLDVHQRGVGTAGIYPRDLAETKTAMVFDLARKNDFPLKCSIERA